MADYTNPPAPWSDLLGYGVANLGWALLFVALVFGRSDFEVLGLHRRSAKVGAGIAFLVGGTVLSNLPASADLIRNVIG
jgi:hypothetical protein